MGWAEQVRDTKKVRTNADTPADAEEGSRMGTEVIGCCAYRAACSSKLTDQAFRKMICLTALFNKEGILAKMEPNSSRLCYEALEGNPVTSSRFAQIRRSTEFVFQPKKEDIKKLADAQGKTL